MNEYNTPQSVAPVPATPVPIAVPTQRYIPEEGAPKTSSKKMWIFLGIFVMIIIIGGVSSYFLFMESPPVISSADLSRGTLIEIGEGREVTFEIGEEEHKLIIDSVSDNSIEIIIQSKIIRATLNVGETKRFDLDDDGMYDIQVELRGIENNKPNLFIKKISEVDPASTQVLAGDDSQNGASQVLSDESQNQTNQTLSISSPTCSELSGDTCNDVKRFCNGNWINASDTYSCCDEVCVVEAVSNDSNDGSCESKGLYEVAWSSYDECVSPGIKTYYTETNSSFACCDIPSASPSGGLPAELRNIWDSIQDSGNCTSDFIFNLARCDSYKCSFVHVFSQATMRKGVIGQSNGKCHSLEEMPNNGESYCSYSDSQLIDMVDYLGFYEEQCGSGDCLIVLNETGYFVNNISTENVPQDMISSGDCVMSFG